MTPPLGFFALIFGLMLISWIVMSRNSSLRDQYIGTEDAKTQVRLPTVKLPSTIVLLLVAILLAVTNPSQADFGDYLLRVGTGPSTSSDPLTMAITRMMLSAFGPMADRRDFAVFSIYKVTMDKNTEYMWIGILKQFIPWPAGWPKPSI